MYASASLMSFSFCAFFRALSGDMARSRTRFRCFLLFALAWFRGGRAAASSDVSMKVASSKSLKLFEGLDALSSISRAAASNCGIPALSVSSLSRSSWAVCAPSVVRTKCRNCGTVSKTRSSTPRAWHCFRSAAGTFWSYTETKAMTALAECAAFTSLDVTFPMPTCVMKSVCPSKRSSAASRMAASVWPDGVFRMTSGGCVLASARAAWSSSFDASSPRDRVRLSAYVCASLSPNVASAREPSSVGSAGSSSMTSACIGSSSGYSSGGANPLSSAPASMASSPAGSSASSLPCSRSASFISSAMTFWSRMASERDLDTL
mmetsp:Transcript_35625/g.111973  ORF Transcript_35625/g.111973 Transcript_35625/m.111973 type:complete len:320 (+) Transcript_35625:168-1127(+)